MSLGVAFKGPEGIVLAVDSRVTLNAEKRQGNTKIVLPATYDNATKLLRVKGQDYVGVVTFGLGAFGQPEPRTAHSFLPEFEDWLAREQKSDEKDGMLPTKRLPVEEFARKLGEFFLKQWNERMPADYQGEDMVFFVAGYNEEEAYGRLYELKIPSQPEPHERLTANEGTFGVLWGGQRAIVDRILNGFDERTVQIVQSQANLSGNRTAALNETLRRSLSMPIPYQFLPLQDCVDLSILLVRTTIALQRWVVDVRGVGGDIDVATITRTNGFESVQQKKITGELH